MKLLLKVLAFLFTCQSFAIASVSHVRVECVNGVPPEYKQVTPIKVTLNLDYGGSPMSGLNGYRGKLNIEMSDHKEISLDVVTNTQWSKISFWGRNDDLIILSTYSDLLQNKALKRNAELSIENSDQWKKTFFLICERII